MGFKLNRRSFCLATAGILMGGLNCKSSNPTLFMEVAAEGDPAHLGRVHGERCASLIKRNIDFYVNWIGASASTSPEKVLERASGFKPVIRKHLPHQMEEMEGIAKGSGRAIEEILMLNARTDLLVMARDEEPGCTAMAVKRNNTLALGQNWDWNPLLSGNGIVLRVKPTGKPKLVTFTEAGMLGKIGFNEFSLGVCLNFLKHETDGPKNGFGLPVHCLLREVMEQKSLKQAIQLVSYVPRCASANFLMAQHQGEMMEAVDLEWTASAVARMTMKEGLITHTNHFKNPVFGTNKKEGSSTYDRDTMAIKLLKDLAQEVPDPVERIQRVLQASIISRDRTLAGVVMDLSKNLLYLVKGAPHRGTWIQRPGA